VEKQAFKSLAIFVGVAFKSLAIFVGVLIVMKFFFGWNISIIGSVMLTIVLSFVLSAVNRR
jgi:hypothetical protein